MGRMRYPPMPHVLSTMRGMPASCATYKVYASCEQGQVRRRMNLVAHLGQCSYITEGVPRICNCLHINCLGSLINSFHKRRRIVLSDPVDTNTELFEGNLELIVRSTVEEGPKYVPPRYPKSNVKGTYDETKLSPVPAIFKIARSCAACPEEVARAWTPPSRSAIRFSKILFVGLDMRE